MMKIVSRTVLAATVALSLGAGLALPAMAQERGPGQRMHQFELHQQHDRGDMRGWQGREGRRGHMRGMEDNRQGMHRMGRGMGPLLMMSCGPRAAERLEIALVRLSHRVDLTEAQQPLFDDLRTSALSAQASLAESCPTTPQTDGGSLSQHLRQMQAITAAQSEALATILPKLEAFENSLTAEQKTAFNGFDGRRGGRRMQQLDQAPGTETQPGTPGGEVTEPAQPTDTTLRS